MGGRAGADFSGQGRPAGESACDRTGLESSFGLWDSSSGVRRRRRVSGVPTELFPDSGLAAVAPSSGGRFRVRKTV